MAEPNVLNLFMLGTGQHSKTTQTVLTQLADNIEVSPTQSVHLINGVGGKAKKNPESPMVGTYKFDCTYDPITGKIKSEKTLKSFINRSTALGAQIRASGYRDSILEAIKVIDAMIKAEKKPLIINAYGFSRGGDGILRLANIVSNIYPASDVQFNLLAMDPVAGPGRRSAKKARFIPANVNNYECILMRDETRIAFEPQDKSQLVVQDSNKTNVTFHSLNGVHASMQTFNDKLSNFNSKLAYDVVNDFATKNKSIFKSLQYIYKTKGNGKKSYVSRMEKPMSDDDRLNCYTGMKLKEVNTILKLDLFSRRREFLANAEDYFVHGAKFFHDKKHMLLFKDKYPAVFDYFFQMNKAGVESTLVMKELNEIKQDKSLEKLIDKLILKDVKLAKVLDTGVLPPATGIPVKLDDLAANAELGKAWSVIQNACNYVLSGYDRSIDKKLVSTFKNYTLNVIKEDMTIEAKVEKLKKAATQVSEMCKRKDQFSLILDQLTPHNLGASIVVDRTVNELAKIMNGSRFGLFSKASNPQQKQVIWAAIKMLTLLGKENVTDASAINQVLNTALRANSKTVASSNKALINDPVDKCLRQAMISVSLLNESSLGQKLSGKVQEKLTEFENQLNPKPAAPSVSVKPS